jgi:uncharacterized protein
MRAPARAQDLILGQRVDGYRAGELERRYTRLAIEEAFFFNYGFLGRETLGLLHPRGEPRGWDARMLARGREVLEFVRERGGARAKEVQAHFDHGSIRRWGADLNVSAHLLEGLHYGGFLRVERRVGGARIYRAMDWPAREDSAEGRLERAGLLVDLVVRLYAPLPAGSLGYLCRLMRDGVPHLAAELRMVQERAGGRYAGAEVDGVRWFWPRGENPAAAAWRDSVDDGRPLRFLAPFDPVVWDRRRFRLFWGWEYKLEAYVPAHRRRMGHYAMPVLWGEEVVGWANLKVVGGELRCELGFVGARPRGRAFRSALEVELRRMREFLGL